MSSRDTRVPGKQGSWYSGDAQELRQELEQWLNLVPNDMNGSSVPVPGARVIIAPHAGYSYSGPTAAWAYKSLDLSRAKRVFLLGPSHTYRLSGCAVTGFKNYGTPFGNLRVDTEVVGHLRHDLSLPAIPGAYDEAEHSLEMHLPYLWHRLAATFGPDPSAFPPVVPILVGNGNKAQQRNIGSWLLPYLRDEDNAFIVSSDFCHWGLRFGYRPYSPNASTESGYRLYDDEEVLTPAAAHPIYETIETIDLQAMEAIKTGRHAKFYDNLEETGNTVCGRNPISVMMAAMEQLAEERGGKPAGASSQGTEGRQYGKFQFVKYDRSDQATRGRDHSVSYVSAYAVV